MYICMLYVVCVELLFCCLVTYIVGFSRNRRYKTISGPTSGRARGGDGGEKIDLDFLKTWGKPGSDSPADKATTLPPVSDSRESKGEINAKKPVQGSGQQVPSAPAVGTKPEPVKPKGQTGVAKGASLFGSADKGPAPATPKKTSNSEKDTNPEKPPMPTKLPKPVEKIAQMRKAALMDTSGSQIASSTTGAGAEEAPSQPTVAKKRHSFLSSLLRPSSPKRGEKPVSPAKVKQPGSAKEKHSGSASPQKKSSKLQVAKQGKSSPLHKPAVQKAAEGSKQTPASASESKGKSPETVARSQPMENVTSINSVVNFYEQRISQLQPSAGTGGTAKKPPISDLPQKQQKCTARNLRHRGKEEVDIGLYSRAYHSMLNLSEAATDSPTQPVVESREVPPSTPPTSPPPPSDGDGDQPQAPQDPRPALQERRNNSGHQRTTWALDDIAESKGEVRLSLQAGRDERWVHWTL